MVRAPVPILAQQGDLQVMQRQQVGVADSKRAGQLRLVGEQAGVAAMADVCSAPSAGALNCSAARSPTKSRTACPSPSSAAAPGRLDRAERRQQAGRRRRPNRRTPRTLSDGSPRNAAYWRYHHGRTPYRCGRPSASTSTASSKPPVAYPQHRRDPVDQRERVPVAGHRHRPPATAPGSLRRTGRTSSASYPGGTTVQIPALPNSFGAAAIWDARSAALAGRCALYAAITARDHESRRCGEGHERSPE